MKIFVFKLFLLLTHFSFCQTTLLSDWQGHYEGTLFLEFPDGRKDSLEIHLDLFEEKNPAYFSYKVSFFSAKYGNQVKDYGIELNPKYADNRHFTLDEKDGILIDEVLLNNTLYSQYSVAGSNFQTVLRKEGNTLYYEIICSSPDKGIESKSEEMDENGQAFEVKSSMVYTVQYARLHKK